MVHIDRWKWEPISRLKFRGCCSNLVSISNMVKKSVY